jgi:hypothetical protein
VALVRLVRDELLEVAREMTTEESISAKGRVETDQFGGQRRRPRPAGIT